MVRSILADMKTQTRRLVKGAALEWLAPEMFTPEFVASPENHLCPYGFAGDRLWVRETWARTFVAQAGQEWVVYREGDNRTDYGGPWKPGIHLFRKDARILLEVTGVRVERLRDISEADAQAEGIAYSERFSGYCIGEAQHYHSADPRESYFSLWEAINGAGSVAANPWVWVVEFQRAAARA